MHRHWKILKKTLGEVYDREPERPIVVLVEYGFAGANVMLHGAPLPGNMKVRAKVIHLGITTYMASSIDTTSWSTPLPPDSTLSGRARNSLIENLLDKGPWAESTTFYRKALTAQGATSEPLPRVMDSLYVCQDRVLQMSSPGFEYERSDYPSHFKIGGALPRRPVDPKTVYPSWWDEVTSGAKKIVLVAQGTLAVNYDDLLLPTIRGLSGRDDLLVIGILGIRGATLDTADLPSNTRIIDYFPYDAILPHAAVFVSNGGYGTVLHAVTNGTPVIMAGASEDKPHVAALSAWSGIGIDLKTGSPSEEDLRDAVERVLGEKGDVTYKERVVRMRDENEAMDPLSAVERCVMEMVGSE